MIDLKNVSGHLLRATYISLGKDYPLRWRFYFYNGGDAWRLIGDAMSGETGTFGGHGSVAGGSIQLPDPNPRALRRLERRLERNILRSVGMEGANATGLADRGD